MGSFFSLGIMLHSIGSDQLVFVSPDSDVYADNCSNSGTLLILFPVRFYLLPAECKYILVYVFSRIFLYKYYPRFVFCHPYLMSNVVIKPTSTFSLPIFSYKALMVSMATCALKAALCFSLIVFM